MSLLRWTDLRMRGEEEAVRGKEEERGAGRLREVSGMCTALLSGVWYWPQSCIVCAIFGIRRRRVQQEEGRRSNIEDKGSTEKGRGQCKFTLSRYFQKYCSRPPTAKKSGFHFGKVPNRYIKVYSIFLERKPYRFGSPKSAQKSTQKSTQKNFTYSKKDSKK